MPQFPKKRTDALSPKQLVMAGAAATQNASDLHTDAALLLANGRLTRATALIAMGFEEVGKACLCLSALQAQPTDWRGEFWAPFYSHEEKWRLYASCIEAAADPEGRELPPHFPKYALDIRERALYVDVDENGEYKTPRGLVEAGGMNAHEVAVTLKLLERSIAEIADKVRAADS